MPTNNIALSALLYNIAYFVGATETSPPRSRPRRRGNVVHLSGKCTHRDALSYSVKVAFVYIGLIWFVCRTLRSLLQPRSDQVRGRSHFSSPLMVWRECSLRFWAAIICMHFHPMKAIIFLDSPSGDRPLVLLLARLMQFDLRCLDIWRGETKRAELRMSRRSLCL